MGTDLLFENHTIKEIQEIEKKLRNDIERKKEELRQMVGERYRDLMEAADTITEMKEIAESVTCCIKSIENSCTELQSNRLQNGIMNAIEKDVVRKKKEHEILYVVASQIKVLMDAPSKIWSSIDQKDFVCAISLYLLAQHIHSLLSLNPIYKELNVSARFPIIHRQWASVSNFRQVLLKDTEKVLKTLSIEPEDVLGPLCCNCLLTNTPLDQMLSQILNTRKILLKSIFSPTKYAKDQICEFVIVVQSTLKMIYILLYPTENDNMNEDYKVNLFNETLEKLIRKDCPGPVSFLDLQTSDIYKFLPAEVIEFRPIVSISTKPLGSDLLVSKCNEWLEDIKVEFQKEIASLLSFVKSVQSLASIREAVFDKLSDVKHWDKLCSNLLKKSFSIWDYFLKECFWIRIENIISEQVTSASELCQKDVEETLHKIGLDNEIYDLKLEKNVSLYVWTESPEDVMDNIAWLPRHHRNYWNSGELSMKAMGFTPKVQSICRDLDIWLQNALEDISYFSYLQSNHLGESEDKGKVSLFQKLSANIPKDGIDIYKQLTLSVEKHFFELTKFMETTLSCFENETINSENSYRIVFIGHLCYGIANLCPYINICLSSDKLCESVEKCLRQGTKVTFSTTTFKENDSCKDLKKKLLEISSYAFRLWSKGQIQLVLNKVNSELHTGSTEGLLKSLLQWDKIEIQEESEQGNAVNSVLRIPQHVSTPISNAIYAFCLNLNAVGGFAINSDVRTGISKQLLIGLLDIYKAKADATCEDFNSRTLQVQSLQLLFDVQFLTGLLVHKNNTCDLITKPSQYIIEKCVSNVDPFDMDVFSVPLQQNIKKALQKSLTLFGLLTSPDQVSYLNSMKSTTLSSQMDHNIMLSSSAGSRFPLLPLSTKPNQSSSTTDDQCLPLPKEKEVKNLPSHSSSPNLSASDIQTNTMKSAASFYDRVTAMSSSWFGN